MSNCDGSETSMVNYTEQTIEKANEILNKGIAFQFMIKTWEESYATVNDDYSLGGAVLCSAVSTLVSNTKGIHVKASGASGSGKSEGILQMLRLMPDGKVHDSSLTAKSLYYNKFESGTILYCDDIDPKKDDVYPVFKQAATHYQSKTQHTTAKGTLEINPRMAWMMSAVKDFEDEQLASRVISIKVANSPERNEAIHKKQVQNENIKQQRKISSCVLVCQCIMDILIKGGLYDVRIPYSEAIACKSGDQHREFPKFQDIIRCMTVLNSKQREQVDGCYIAGLEDFELARELYDLIKNDNVYSLDEVAAEQAIAEWKQNNQ